MPPSKQIPQPVRELIIEKWKANEKQIKIAKDLRLDPKTVNKIIIKYKKTGKSCVLPRSGRKRITTKTEDKHLISLVRSSRKETASQITAKWNDITNKDVSTKTTTRRLKEKGYSFYTALKKPLLTPVMKKKRLSWAREHQTWTTEQWKKVIFSDESRFCLFNDGYQKVVRRKGEQFHPACVSSQVKFPPSVMVYGSMCTYGVGSLCFIHGNKKQ
uniref:Transposase Tc1-like domain-containing protein n=1 Tax=Strigamia maritima TaxID=126957 RepID=T1IM15_STRMM